jgi:hypothetical protein
MNKPFLSTLLLFAFSSVSLVAADPKDEIKAAARKLADKQNYSWTATPKSEGDGIAAGAGVIEGQTEKGGFTYVTMTVGNNDIEMAFKGDKAAIKREDEWQATDELEGNNAWIADRLKAFKAPAAEAAEFVGKIEELKNADGVYSGDLSESQVKEIMARGRGRRGAEPEGAKGWAKFWIKDGLLSKYQYNVQGKLTVGQDKREVSVNRTTTVEVKEIGSTTLKVPSGAKKKLEK